MVDLHTHSHFSDGDRSPWELVRQAKACGLSAWVSQTTTRWQAGKSCSKRAGPLGSLWCWG